VADSGSITLKGAPRFEADLDRAARELEDLRDAATEVARVVRSAGSSESPRRTGALAASLTSSAGRNLSTITSGLVYAIPIHYGRPAHGIEANPFLMRAAQKTEPVWTGIYERSVQRVADSVRGE
jgi:hypothetical protein